MSRRPAHGQPTTNKPLCPSAPLYEGSQLLGVVNATGGVTLLTEPLPLTPDFVEAATTASRPPEDRFRFVNRCVEKGCAKWTDGGCSVVKGALERLAGSLPQPPPDGLSAPILPSCGVRPSCRWFMQEGPSACHACPQITYYNRE